MRTISVSSSRPTLDITSTRAIMEIKNTVRRHFTSKRTPPQMQVNRTSPRMRVNWTDVWAKRGMRKPRQQSQHLNQQSYQKVHQSIQKAVQDGNFMGALEQYYDSDTNRVGQLQLQEVIQGDIPDLNVAPPNPLPEVEWEKGSLTIEWTPGDLELVWEEDFRPQVTVTPHSVEIRLRGRNEVKITVNEDNVSGRSGKKVDRNI